MKKSMVGFTVAAMIVCFVTVGFAFEFSADVVNSGGGHSMTSKMFMKDKNIRMEPQGQPSYTIMRGDKGVMWMVMPAQKSYMEMKPDPANKPKTEEKVQGEVSRKLIGSETIDKHPTQKYEVTYTEKGKSQKMYQWMATDMKFPIKMAAVDGSWSVEYKNMKMGGQPDSLFEVPPGYSKMAMPAMPSGIPRGR